MTHDALSNTTNNLGHDISYTVASPRRQECAKPLLPTQREYLGEEVRSYRPIKIVGREEPR